jgi:hypothetical protein
MPGSPNRATRSKLEVKGESSQGGTEVAVGKYSSSMWEVATTSSQKTPLRGIKRRKANESADSYSDSDEEFIPGHKTRAGLKRSKKPDAENSNRSRQKSTGSSNKRRKIDSEQASRPRGVDASTQLDASEASETRSTRTVSEVQETEGERNLADLWKAVVRECGGKYWCSKCNIEMGKRGDMTRHLQTLDHQEKSYICIPGCLDTFTRKDSLKRHVQNRHKNEAIEIYGKIAYKVQ